jgi:hypothetical protein
LLLILKVLHASKSKKAKLCITQCRLEGGGVGGGDEQITHVNAQDPAKHSSSSGDVGSARTDPQQTFTQVRVYKSVTKRGENEGELTGYENRQIHLPCNKSSEKEINSMKQIKPRTKGEREKTTNPRNRRRRRGATRRQGGSGKGEIYRR